MKKLSIVSFSLSVCFFFVTSYAGTLFSLNESNNQVSDLTFSRTTQLSAQYFNPLKGPESLTFQDSLTKEQRLAQLPGYKLPKRALFFSAVIPGTGELYSKSYLKAVAFFLLEAGAWAWYGSYNKKGGDKEDEYQQFADEHWDPMKWRSWYENAPKELQDQFTHAGSMVELLNENKKTQQYYEMLGKYSEFVVGWEGVTATDLQYDFDTIIKYRQNKCKIADDYMKMRAESNDLFAKARTGTTIAMLNHLLSAIDAAWTAKRHNNSLLQTSLRFEQIYYVDHLQPVLSLKIKW